MTVAPGCQNNRFWVRQTIAAPRRIEVTLVEPSQTNRLVAPPWWHISQFKALTSKLHPQTLELAAQQRIFPRPTFLMSSALSGAHLARGNDHNNEIKIPAIPGNPALPGRDQFRTRAQFFGWRQNEAVCGRDKWLAAWTPGAPEVGMPSNSFRGSHSRIEVCDGVRLGGQPRLWILRAQSLFREGTRVDRIIRMTFWVIEVD